jgi:hypothetical protein
MRRLVLMVLIALLLGCGTARIEPPYTEVELKAICERRGGWWHDGTIREGFCEYQTPGFL